ncbi:beta-mannosidase-like protein, partial [Leptotrombidium deliense]
METIGFSSTKTRVNHVFGIRISAQVPGGIYTDLYHGKVLKSLLKEDDDTKNRWVAYDTWTFQKHFMIPSGFRTKRGVYLTAHGIDTVSEIFLNGQLIGKTENMFVRYQFDMKPFLLNGSNVITVKFTSPVLYGKKKHDEQLKKYPIPPVCAPDVQHGECHVNYLRKMQCSFSWDWGPAFPSVGIWKSLDIEAYDYGLIRDIIVHTIYTPENRWIVNTSLVIESVTYNFRATVKIHLNDRLLLQTNIVVTSMPQHPMIVNFPILLPTSEKVKLWWPNGAGYMTSNGYKNLKRTLYTLRATIIPENSPEQSNTKSVSIGFRTIKLIQEQLTTQSSSFYFTVNGHSMFMRGSNWIPAEIFPERMNKERLKSLLLSAKKANINMLRVWGGGIYEPDDFYELANEMGILIWQDLMFAVALYPSNNEFRQSVATEVQQQVRRLQHNPCIAVWAGNNENEEAIASSWWPE